MVKERRHPGSLPVEVVIVNGIIYNETHFPRPVQ